MSELNLDKLNEHIAKLGDWADRQKFQIELQTRLDRELDEERALYDDADSIYHYFEPSPFYPGESQDCEGGE